MTLLFGICLAVGGVTALFALFAGGGHAADAHAGDVGADAHVDAHADVHADVHADAHADAHADVHAVAHADAHADVGAQFWFLFLSMRFWVFFLTFFGLTGLLLQLAGSSSLVAALLALPLGAALGVGAAWVFRQLQTRPVSSAIRQDELVGAEGRVMLPIGPGAPGKVRLQLRGQLLDRVALTEGEGLIERGDRALVIGVRGEKLVVSRAPTPQLGDGEEKG
jgi:membrane protein implicated in regulation of membrane protease activity